MSVLEPLGPPFLDGDAVEVVLGAGGGRASGAEGLGLPPLPLPAPTPLQRRVTVGSPAAVDGDVAVVLSKEAPCPHRMPPGWKWEWTLLLLGVGGRTWMRISEASRARGSMGGRRPRGDGVRPRPDRPRLFTPPLDPALSMPIRHLWGRRDGMRASSRSRTSSNSSSPSTHLERTSIWMRHLHQGFAYGPQYEYLCTVDGIKLVQHGVGWPGWRIGNGIK